MPDVADSGADLCHINLAHGFRGGERQTELLIRELSADLPQQRLIARSGAPLTDRLRDVAGLTIVGAAGRLSAAMASRGAAIIHAHETGAAHAALLRNWLDATPYVITRRVTNVPRPSPFTRRMYLRAARVAVLSNAIRDVVGGYAPGTEMVRIPSACSNLPSSAGWARDYRRRHPGKFLVGNVGVFDFSQKGQDHLLDAAALVEHRHPDIHFVLLGSGRDEEIIRRRSAELGNVSVDGWVENVGDYLAAFDLFAFPSVREGLGSILLDAMQFGLPIVAAQIGGIPDLVVDGTNGLLVPAADSAALAGAIVRLFSDQGLRNAMAERNKQAARGYSARIMAERYLEIYNEVLPRLCRQGRVNQ